MEGQRADLDVDCAERLVDCAVCGIHHSPVPRHGSRYLSGNLGRRSGFARKQAPPDRLRHSHIHKTGTEVSRARRQFEFQALFPAMPSPMPHIAFPSILQAAKTAMPRSSPQSRIVIEFGNDRARAFSAKYESRRLGFTTGRGYANPSPNTDLEARHEDKSLFNRPAGKGRESGQEARLGKSRRGAIRYERINSGPLGQEMARNRRVGAGEAGAQEQVASRRGRGVFAWPAGSQGGHDAGGNEGAAARRPQRQCRGGHDLDVPQEARDHIQEKDRPCERAGAG